MQMLRFAQHDIAIFSHLLFEVPGFSPMHGETPAGAERSSAFRFPTRFGSQCGILPLPCRLPDATSRPASYSLSPQVSIVAGVVSKMSAGPVLRAGSGHPRTQPSPKGAD